MSYGYVDDVDDIKLVCRTRSFYPTVNTARLSDTDLQAIATNVALTRIDPVLAALGVALPISPTASPLGWAVLKELNIMGAACRVDRITFTEKAPNAKAETPWQCTDFEEMVKALQEGKLNLLDIPTGPTTLGVSEFYYLSTEDGGHVDEGGWFPQGQEF
jgi:hypothetical protein